MTSNSRVQNLTYSEFANYLHNTGKIFQQNHEPTKKLGIFVLIIHIHSGTSPKMFKLRSLLSAHIIWRVDIIIL